VAQLARLCGAELLLIHVADGWVARNYDQLKLAESEEMKADHAYLQNIANGPEAQGLKAAIQLGMGEPWKEIVRIAEEENCDLIAMTSHGHRLIGDIIHGSTIHQVRHSTAIPILLVREKK
jgi:manganese transport protein